MAGSSLFLKVSYAYWGVPQQVPSDLSGISQFGNGSPPMVSLGVPPKIHRELHVARK